MLRNIQGYLFLGMVCLLTACSTAKKTTKPTNKPLETALVNPSPVVERTIDSLNSVTDSTDLVPQTQPSDSPIQMDTVLSQQQLVWNMMLGGIDKNYDYASAMHYDVSKPQFVMIHHTSQNSLAQTIRTFQLAHTKVSSHYIIGRDGRIVQMLNDYLRGWHAGRGKWGAITDMNSVSIGIELDNNGQEPFPEAQIDSLMSLLDSLKNKYSIPQKNFIGHSDFSPTRKNDPNVFFPWHKLAQKGFGIWYNPDYLPAVPANFNPIDALKIMGYDTSNLPAVIKSFKRKFIKSDLSEVLTDRDKAVLYDLYRKYY